MFGEIFVGRCFFEKEKRVLFFVIPPTPKKCDTVAKDVVGNLVLKETMVDNVDQLDQEHLQLKSFASRVDGNAFVYRSDTLVIAYQYLEMTRSPTLKAV